MTIFIAGRHPEAQRGEVYIGNYDLNDYTLLDWKTKRRSMATDETNAQFVSFKGERDLTPVFVQMDELIACGITVADAVAATPQRPT